MADTDVRLDTALFVVAGEDMVLPTAFARGPWSLGWLHGGPVAALLAHAVEQLASDGVDWFVARLTVEMQRPVPVEPLRYHAEVTRAGRKVSIVEAVIAKADTGAVLARARALRIRAAHVPLPFVDKDLGPLLAIEPAPCEPADGRLASHDEDAAVAFHNGGTERRYVGESELGVGPVFAWIRLRVPLLPEHTLTPLQRVAGAVDFASGISGVLPWDSHSFVNPDLTIHLFRASRGEWVGMASMTHHSELGIAMTDTAVFDLDGRVGNSNQSLLLDLRLTSLGVHRWRERRESLPDSRRYRASRVSGIGRDFRTHRSGPDRASCAPCGNSSPAPIVRGTSLDNYGSAPQRRPRSSYSCRVATPRSRPRRSRPIKP